MGTTGAYRTSVEVECRGGGYGPAAPRSGRASRAAGLLEGTSDGGANEVGLRSCVRLTIALKLLRQIALQRAVFAGDVAMAAKVVAKRQLVAKSR